MHSDSLERTSWFAVQVRTNYERKVRDLLTQKQVEVFLPLYTVMRKWSDREKRLEAPLFSGYLFCHCAYGSGSTIVTTPGVIRFVGAGPLPSPIDDSEIESIQRAVASGLDLTPYPYLETGQSIVLCGGPLSGATGILKSIRDQYLLVVSIQMLQRSVSVVVDRSWVTPLETQAGPSLGSALASTF